MKYYRDFYFRGRRYSIDETARQVVEYAHAYETDFEEAKMALKSTIPEYSLENVDLTEDSITLYQKYLQDQEEMDHIAIIRLVKSKLFTMMDNAAEYKAGDLLKVYEMLLDMADDAKKADNKNPFDNMDTDKLELILEKIAKNK